MSLEQEFDLDAAMLAAMTAGSLNHIDKNMSDKSFEHRPSNQLNVNSFIHTYKHGGTPERGINAANQGYISEEAVRSQAPDISLFSNPNQALGFNPEGVPVPIPMPAPELIPMPQGINTSVQQVIAAGAGIPSIASPTVLQKPAPTEVVDASTLSDIKEQLQLANQTLKRLDISMGKMAAMFGKIFCNINKKDLQD